VGVDVVEFFGPPGARCAGFTHVPDAEPVAGLVVCSSLFNEFTKNYRREVSLAHALASTVAVQRFHYRGTGHSDDCAGGPTFESMLDDTMAAVDRLRALSGVDRVVVLGTRLGGLVAAAASTALGAAPVALIEPVVEPAKFFREGFRANLAQGVKGRNPGATVAAQLDQLRAAGHIDVVGDTLRVGLYDSIIDRTVVGELGDDARPVLLAQLGGDQPLRTDLEAAVTSLRDRGFDVETRCLGRREMWWFVDERDFFGAEAERPLGMEPEDEVVTAVAAWLACRTGA
jgi:pimeloyl-ACP methyl ester carboxylesterase